MVSGVESQVDELNRQCRIISVDRGRLRELLSEPEAELGIRLTADDSTMFAASPVFVPREHLLAMERVVRVMESVAATDGYREHVLGRAPEICRVDHGPTGAFFGFDFHLGVAGPKLIEINTNAGGGLINLALARAQRLCCIEAGNVVAVPHDLDVVEEAFVDMFRREWASQRPHEPLRRVAIVDDDPTSQYLYPEFLITAETFRRAGLEVVIADPGALELEAGRLHVEGQPIDLVYNRSCDFYLEHNQTLAEAYVRGSAVVTPNPRAYALFADKRNLVLLSDPARLRALGVAEQSIEVLADAVPHTISVSPENAEQLWRERKHLFFKPATGFGSRATYRGSKLTKKTWQTIVDAPYVAQELVPPSERTIDVDGKAVPLKLDLRAFAFRGEVQLFAARLYRGQTTNFRTPGGGFASVYTRANRST